MQVTQDVIIVCVYIPVTQDVFIVCLFTSNTRRLVLLVNNHTMIASCITGKYTQNDNIRLLKQ
jgi:hypothetical protein